MPLWSGSALRVALRRVAQSDIGCQLPRNGQKRPPVGHSALRSHTASRDRVLSRHSIIRLALSERLRWTLQEDVAEGLKDGHSGVVGGSRFSEPRGFAGREAQERNATLEARNTHL